MDLSALADSDVKWWQVILALIIVVAGWLIARFAKKGVTALLHRAPGLSEAIIVFAARFTQYLLLVFTIGLALAVLGANIQPLLAIVAIVAIIAILVLRGVADNFAAGVLIQARHPVVLGDEIQIEGPDGDLWTGVVQDLNSRAVIMLSYDGRTVHIPNSKLLADPLVNSSTAGGRRTEVQVRAERAGAPVDGVLQTVTDAAAGVDGVRAEPPARAVLVSVAPERVVARVMFWHDPTSGLTVTSDVVHAISSALEAAGHPATVTSKPGVPPLVPSDRV